MIGPGAAFRRGLAGTSPGRSRGRGAVLIVEDDPDLRELLRLSLEEFPVDLYEAADGASALDFLERARPSVVLLDLKLPGALDGVAVCERIKGDPKLREVAVIIVSACAQPADFRAADAARADAYVVKPFSPLELLDLVNRALRSSEARASQQSSVALGPGA